MTFEGCLWLIAAVCIGIYFVLGSALARAAALWRVDVEAAAMRGQATPLAAIFTRSGRALPLLAIALMGIAIAAIARVNVLAAVAILAMQLISQGAVELLKQLFHRARPDAWLVHEELGYSYPSGHAATAIVFFGSWLVFVLISPLPKTLKLALAALLAVWMIGIDWSRLALSAHYPTDVFGGTLVGVAFACMLWALLLHFRVVSPVFS